MLTCGFEVFDSVGSLGSTQSLKVNDLVPVGVVGSLPLCELCVVEEEHRVPALFDRLDDRGDKPGDEPVFGDQVGPKVGNKVDQQAVDVGTVYVSICHDTQLAVAKRAILGICLVLAVHP